jgi:sulfite exporter TauE/SafE
MPVALAGVFAASLVGSVHCAAMCGGFGCLAAAQGPRVHAAYHGGRLLGYAALGAAAGSVGAMLDRAGVMAGVGRVAAPIAALVAIAWGVGTLFRKQRAISASTGAPRGGHIAAVLRRVRSWSPTGRGLMLGLVTALLPCGWLWLFVATAAGTGTAWHGAMAMALFWAGSVPLLAAASMAGGRLAAVLGRWRPRVAAGLLVLVGAWTLVGYLRAASAAGAPHASMVHAHE